MKRQAKGRRETAADRRDRNVFLFTLGITLFLVLTAVGLVAVDAQGRRLSFGDEIPPFRAVDRPGGGKDLEIRLFGAETALDITEIDNFWNFLLDFTCIPHN